MTHDEAIDTLLALARGRQVGAARRDAAETHASACVECLETVQLIHGATVGSPERERTSSLFGCDGVQEGLYQLVGLDPQTARTRHPGILQHLSWCTSCRADLTALARTERHAAQGTYDPPSPTELWAEVAERVYELKRVLTIGIDAAAARWRDVAEEFRLAIGPAPAFQTRGDEHVDASLDVSHQCVAVALGTTGLTARLEVEGEGKDRARLTITVEGDARRAMTVALRRVDSASSAVVAAQSSASARAFIVRELPLGEYLVEIAEVEPQRRFRFRLHAKPGGGDLETI